MPPDELTMLLHELDAIFVHVPKTAGNFLTRECLGRYSNDRLVVRGHQDGLDRFEIRGEVTKHKHMTLSEYSASIDLSNLSVMTALRDPVERLISAYFSPHRRYRLGPRGKLVSATAKALRVDITPGPSAYREVPVGWTADKFQQFVSRERRYSDYLDGYTAAKGLFVLRPDSLLDDLNAVLRHLGANPVDISRQSQRVNVSGTRLSERQQEASRSIVMASQHADDYGYLEQLGRDAIDLNA